MVKPVRKNSNKNPPILSHEFIIQNHADIVSCVAMVFIIGLMVQTTTPFATVFITMSHNITDVGVVQAYSPGILDLAAVFFYSLISIVLHAIFQEYALDKISKKLHLSKSKLAVFTNSGQLSMFSLISTLWGGYLLVKELHLVEVARHWSDYPSPMSFLLKLFVIIQLSYTVHELPELYFQKTKREEYVPKALRILATLAAIAIPYFLNYNRLLVSLLVLHHLAELVKHVVLLLGTVDKEEKFSKAGRLVSSIAQILARLSSVILAYITCHKLSLVQLQQVNLETGNFNIVTIRWPILIGIMALQTYLILDVVTQELANWRESKTQTPAKVAPKLKQAKKQVKKSSKRSAPSEESDLPEVDQNTNKTLLKNKQKIK